MSSNEAVIVDIDPDWGTKVNGPACAPGQRARRVVAAVGAVGILTFLVRRASIYARVREVSKGKALLITALAYVALIVVAAAVPLILFIGVMALSGV